MSLLAGLAGLGGGAVALGKSMQGREKEDREEARELRLKKVEEARTRRLEEYREKLGRESTSQAEDLKRESTRQKIKLEGAEKQRLAKFGIGLSGRSKASRYNTADGIVEFPADGGPAYYVNPLDEKPAPARVTPEAPAATPAPDAPAAPAKPAKPAKPAERQGGALDSDKRKPAPKTAPRAERDAQAEAKAAAPTSGPSGAPGEFNALPPQTRTALSEALKSLESDELEEAMKGLTLSDNLKKLLRAQLKANRAKSPPKG